MLKYLVLIILLFLSAVSFSDTRMQMTPVAAPPPVIPPDPNRLTVTVNWSSKGQTDSITIQNGNNIPIIVVISVNTNATGTAPGITLKNCGTTTHVDAGSVGVCANRDGTNPISFNSDSSNTIASGTYQLKQQ